MAAEDVKPTRDNILESWPVSWVAILVPLLVFSIMFFFLVFPLFSRGPEAWCGCVSVTLEKGRVRPYLEDQQKLSVLSSWIVL